jgi:hypothetical protein
MALRVAYLACSVTLPGAVNRRVDAFEHDQTMAALATAFERHGDVVEAIAWDDPDARFERYDAAVIGTTWDYWDRHAEFLEKLRRIEAETRLFNPSSLVAWNSDKRYLADLAARGVPIPPTRFLDHATEDAVRDAFDALSLGPDEEVVIKRRIGAGAHGQHRLRRGEPVPLMPEPMLVQPFLPSVVTEGELSFVFVDGELSHALEKRPKSGDYRVQSAFGGWQSAIAPRDDDVTRARDVLDRLDALPLYARVDMVRARDGALLLMELEVIEPFLYPLQGPRFGELFHAALRRRAKEGSLTAEAR